MKSPCTRLSRNWKKQRTRLRKANLTTTWDCLVPDYRNDDGDILIKCHLDDKYTWVNQKFCNILVIWGTIWPLQLLRSWKWQTIHDVICWTLQELLTRSNSMVRNTPSKFTVLDLPDFTWWLKFLLPRQNFLNYLVILL